MPRRAILYIALVVSAGVAVLLHAAWNWNTRDPQLFAGLLALAACLSTMKIRLPRVTGTLAAGFVPVLASVALLSAGETVVIACVSAIVQTIWQARVRPAWIQVAFNGAVLSLSALAAYHVAHWPASGVASSAMVAALGLAAATDYLLDSLFVSIVLCLLEDRPLSGIFGDCNLWALPYYFIGVLVVSALVGLRFLPAWRIVIPTLPIMWAVYDCYRRYILVLSRAE